MEIGREVTETLTVIGHHDPDDDDARQGAAQAFLQEQAGARLEGVAEVSSCMARITT
jgi:hypothetical protein